MTVFTVFVWFSGLSFICQRITLFMFSNIKINHSSIGRVRGRDGSRESINPPYINLPSPNVQDDVMFIQYHVIFLKIDDISFLFLPNNNKYRNTNCFPDSPFLATAITSRRTAVVAVSGVVAVVRWQQRLQMKRKPNRLPRSWPVEGPSYRRKSLLTT